MATPQTQMTQQLSPQGGGFGRRGRNRLGFGQQFGQEDGQDFNQFDFSKFQNFRPQGGQQGQFMQPRSGGQAILGGFPSNMRFSQANNQGQASTTPYFNQQAQTPAQTQGQATAQAPQPFTPTTLPVGLTRGDLQVGTSGNVNVDPFTGAKIPLADRVSRSEYMRDYFNDQSQGLLQGPAIQEAQNFQFDLPDSGVQGLLPQITGAAQGMLSGGQSNLQQGQQFTQGGGQSLLGNIQKTGQAADQSSQERSQALAQLQDLQQQALSPNVDPQQRQFLQQMADEARANIQTRFAEGGDIANQFTRQNAADVANLAARGVLDSQTGANVIGRRQADLGALAANLLGEADNAANQRLLDERNRVTQAATAFGGIQGQQATGAGGILANLLETQGKSGSYLGNLGTSQQGIGAQLSQLGLSGLNQAGQLGLADQGQQADQQQAALSTRMMGNQLGLQNIQSYLNQILGRQVTQQGMDLQSRLAEAQLNPADTLSLMNFLIPSTSWIDEQPKR